MTGRVEPGRLRRKLIAISLCSSLTLLGLEVLVRVWGYSQHRIHDPIYTSFSKTADLPYVHKPNLARARARGLAAINTDALGLRSMTAGGHPGHKPRNEYRIAIAGDSVTFGEGVPRTEETFPQVLEGILNEPKGTMSFRAFNFGVSAYSVKEMVLTLRHRMLEIQPDLVVMAIIPPDFNLDRTPVIDETGYLTDRSLTHLSPPGSMVRRVLRDVHLSYVLKDIGARFFIEGAKSVRDHSRDEVPGSYRYVRQFKKIAEDHGLGYVIAILPSVGESPWVSLSSQMSSDHITFVDLAFLWNEFPKKQFMSSRFDVHPSSAVHRRIGEALAAHVRNRLLERAP